MNNQYPGPNWLTETELEALLRDDPYENVSNRHRFALQDEGAIGPLQTRDHRWLFWTTVGLVAFWAAVIWWVRG